MKNSNDTIGNRNRDLPTCSAVPQPTALPRAPEVQITYTGFLQQFFYLSAIMFHIAHCSGVRLISHFISSRSTEFFHIKCVITKRPGVIMLMKTDIYNDLTAWIISFLD
jgi:hypothetical protein